MSVRYFEADKGVREVALMKCYGNQEKMIAYTDYDHIELTPDYEAEDYNEVMDFSDEYDFPVDIKIFSIV